MTDREDREPRGEKRPEDFRPPRRSPPLKQPWSDRDDLGGDEEDMSPGTFWTILGGAIAVLVTVLVLGMLGMLP